MLEQELGEVVLRVVGNDRDGVAAEEPDGAAAIAALEDQLAGAALLKDQAGEFGKGVVFQTSGAEKIAHWFSSMWLIL